MFRKVFTGAAAAVGTALLSGAVGYRIARRTKPAKIGSRTARDIGLIELVTNIGPANAEVGGETETSAVAYAAYEPGSTVQVGIAAGLRLAALIAARAPAAIAAATLVRAARRTRRAYSARRIRRAATRQRIMGVAADRTPTDSEIGGKSKYPPAEPGALVREPPKAACVLRVPLYRAVGHLKVAGLDYSKRN